MSRALNRLSVWLWLVAVPFTAGQLLADSTSTIKRTVTKLAEGIYEIRHPDAPDEFPQGNTTVIIGEREVLVVDSCYLPSSAREDIAEIREWTKKPVRHLLNTHWHYDHTMGNSEYVQAFPGIAVMAQTETRDRIAEYNPGWFARFPNRAARFQKMIEEKKDEDGKPLTEGELAETKKALQGLAAVQEEFKSLPQRLRELTPSVSFDREMNLDLGNREVQIKFLGRGNTAGDAVVFLPKEKIVVAGDLMDHPVPYFFGGFPSEQIKTLQNLAQLDAEMFVPGHGDVLHGKNHLENVLRLLQTVLAAVRDQVNQVGAGPRNLPAVLEGVKRNVDFEAFRKQFAGDDKDDGDFFDGSAITGLITALYAETWPR